MALREIAMQHHTVRVLRAKWSGQSAENKNAWSYTPTYHHGTML
jgi:hypothetical protein